jgi:glycosyltransferase involved in cell wall biosynthesis
MKASNIDIYTKSGFPFGLAPENFVRQMAFGLKSNEQNIKVVICKGQPTNSRQNDTNVPSSFLFFKSTSKNEITKAFELFGFFFMTPFSILNRKIINKTNIIILYGIDYFYLIFPIWVLTRILNIKLIRIATDIYHKKTVASVWWKWPKWYFYKLQSNWFDTKLDGIVCVSSYLYNHYLEQKAEIKKLIIIPHFIDLESFATTHQTENNSTNTRIGFCGTALLANGIIELIDATLRIVKNNQNFELLMIGEIPENLKDQIEKMILNHESHFVFVGRKTNNEIPSLLNSCDILVNPRRSGVFAEAGFPTKLGEYFATSKPIVATAVGDLKHYFDNGNQLILVNPDSSEAIVEGITLLLKDPMQAKIIGKNGFNWAKENLDYKNNAKKLITFLDQ